MTSEREKEIREWILDACGSGHPVNELLAELDRLREQNSDWRKRLAPQLYQEIEQLKATQVLSKIPGEK